MSQKKKLKPLQIGIVAVIAVAFIMYVQFSTNPSEKTLTLESEQEDVENEVPESETEAVTEDEIDNSPYFMEVYSLDELISKFSRNVQGLEKAFELELVKELGQSHSFDQEENEFTIEYIWYNSKGINIIYSTLYNEGEEGHQPIFHLGEGRQTVNRGGSSSYIFEEKLYSHVELEPILDEQENLIKQIDDVYTYSIDLVHQYNRHKLQDIDIPLEFDQSKEDDYSFDVAIDETLYEDEEMTFTLDKVKRRIHGNYIKLDFESSGYRVFNLEGEIQVRNSTSMFNEFVQNDPIDLRMYNTENYNGPVDIKLNKANFISDEKLEFSVNTDEFIDEDNQVVDKKLATINGVDYTWSSVINRGNEYIIDLKIKPQMRGLQTQYLFETITRPDGEFNALISLTDENGVEYVEDIMPSDGGIAIPRKIFEEAEKLNVTLSKLIYPKAIGESTTFDVDLSLDE